MNPEKIRIYEHYGGKEWNGYNDNDGQWQPVDLYNRQDVNGWSLTTCFSLFIRVKRKLNNWSTNYIQNDFAAIAESGKRILRPKPYHSIEELLRCSSMSTIQYYRQHTSDTFCIESSDVSEVEEWRKGRRGLFVYTWSQEQSLCWIGC